MTRERRRIAIVLIALAAGVASQGSSAQALQPALRQPTASFSWSMPQRYELGWRAWSERRARYDAGYVRPRRWRLDLNACRSSGGGVPITSYEIRIAAVGSSFRTSWRGTRCGHRFTDLPRLGSYDVTLVVRARRRASRPLTRRVTLRDFLVVSLGDSKASGEGVPDRPGLYTLPFTPRATVTTLAKIFRGNFSPHEVRRVRWQDRRCHRSAHAGHALAARELERRNSHSSVTYVSLACSGAKIAHLIDTSYDGIQPPPAGGKVDPQLVALRRLVGDRRRIDALLLAIGVNDLGFSDIVKRCALTLPPPLRDNPDCVYGTGVTRKVAVGGPLERSYARLAGALRDGLDVAETYITDYPAAPFGQTRGGCGLLGIPKVGISSREAGAIYAVGLQLYWAVGRAAAAQGWNWVPGLTDAFEGRDYCARRSRLVRLESSLVRQGTISGAVHPTRAGHAALAKLLRRSIVLGRPELPYWQAKLVIEQVRVDPAFKEPSGARPIEPPPDPGGPPPLKQQPEPPPPSDQYVFDFSLREIPNWFSTAEHRFSVPKTLKGEWVPVPAELGSFELDLYDPPRPPRYPTSIDFLTRGPNGTLGGFHPHTQRFGAGCHERVHPTGWAIRYRIELTLVDGTPTRPPIRPPTEISLPCRAELAERP